MTGVSGLNSVGEEKAMMLKTYRGPLLIHICWSEFPLDNCCSSYLSSAPGQGEEHDSWDKIRLYKDTMREDAIEFGDPLASFRATTQ